MNHIQPGGTVLVAGAAGLRGSRLTSELEARGYAVRRLGRRASTNPSEFTWDPAGRLLPSAALEGAQCVVVLSGAGVGDRRWTSSYRREILSSRLSTVSLVAQRMAEVGEPTRLIAASAVGIYADRGEEELTETSAPGQGFLAEVCRAWEAAADPARRAGLSVAHARTGLVLSARGGALGKLLPLIRAGVGGPMGTGTQWWPWITLADEVSALSHLVSSDVVGPVNLVAPHAERNGDLIRALARGLNRPAALPVPAIALRAAVGGFASELTASQLVRPAVLESAGFEFLHPALGDALPSLRGTQRT